MKIKMTWPEYLRCECRVGFERIYLDEKERDVLFLMCCRFPYVIHLQEISEIVTGSRDNLGKAQKFLVEMSKTLGRNATIGDLNFKQMICRDSRIQKHIRRATT